MRARVRIRTLCNRDREATHCVALTLLRSCQYQCAVSYKAPTISLLSASALPTRQGTGNFSLLGANLGPNSFTGTTAITLLNVTVVVRYGTYIATCVVLGAGVQLQCQSVDGMGVDLPVSVTVGDQSVTTPFTLSYIVPAITNITVFWTNGTRSSAMPTSGGFIDLDGTNFGPIVPENIPSATLSGAVGTVSLQNCTVITAHSRVRCTTPPGVGANYAATLLVALRSGITSAILVGFAPPLINSMIAPPVMSTTGGEAVTLIGFNFGPTGTAVSLTYRDAQGNASYAASNCLVTQPHTTIRCVTVAGVGRDLTWTLVIGQQSATAPTQTSYAPPSVVGVTSFPTGMATVGGQSMTVQGDLNAADRGTSLTFPLRRIWFWPAWRSSSCHGDVRKLHCKWLQCHRCRYRHQLFYDSGRGRQPHRPRGYCSTAEHVHSADGFVLTYVHAAFTLRIAHIGGSSVCACACACAQRQRSLLCSP